MSEQENLPPATSSTGDNDNNITTTTETTMTDSNTPGEIYGPPAHIAARFYRNALTRRKSSATSSRRNSMSSAHSHASSRSRRRGSAPAFQNTYIAQHLRRASILETRVARLADRAAHAEQVRLRAALHKATPRGNVSNSEERALAAQLAKEKYLAKVAAACAEEVARAKRIAEEVKERKLAEEARVRSEMEEKHAEAERRRAEFQRNMQARRARRADSSEKKLAVVDELEDAVTDTVSPVLTETDAAMRVQRAWRRHQYILPVLQFRELNLTGTAAQDSTFEDLTARVADSNVINPTIAILTHLGLQEANDANAALNTRTFLSAYLIIGHPVSVLTNKNGAQEQDLIVKSAELISLFESAFARLAPWNNYTINALQHETLSQAYTAYTSAFAAWRLQDSSVLIEGMVASFVELDAIWQTVKDDSRGEVANDYREGIRDNQVMLLSRIRKLAGPDRADVLIKKAIRESRRRRPKRRAAAEVRPRGVESATVESVTASEAAAVAVLPIQPIESGELTQLFTPMPSNRVLTHELAIDNEFKLEDKNDHIRDQVYLSICEGMKAGFARGEAALWTVSAAENIREKLLRMLKPGNAMYNRIAETLDSAHIQRQCQQDVFSYPGFFEFMAHILPKLCAPFRDQQIQKLAEDLRSDASGDELGLMTEKLFNILRAVDMLSLDYTNFMIMNAAPTLIKEAPGYEQRLFAKDLETGEMVLDNTKRWWKAARAALEEEANRRDPDGARNPEDRPSSHKIYTHALVETALTQDGSAVDDLPETLHLDAARLEDIRVKAVRIIVIGGTLLTTKNLLKRDVRSQWKTEATRLWQLLSTTPYETDSTTDTTPTQKAFSVLETAHNMPASTKSAIQSTLTRFFAQAASATSSSHLRFTDPVLKVLAQRLRTHILARLSAESAAERVRAASSASEKLAASGMAEFTTHVAAIVSTLERVRTVDWEAHGRWYEEILREG